jgi:hypothetical protein
VVSLNSAYPPSLSKWWYIGKHHLLSSVQRDISLRINFLYCHLLADFLEDVGAATSHTPMGLHCLLQGYLYLFLQILFKFHVKEQLWRAKHRYDVCVCSLHTGFLGTSNGFRVLGQFMMEEFCEHGDEPGLLYNTKILRKYPVNSEWCRQIWCYVATSKPIVYGQGFDDSVKEMHFFVLSSMEISFLSIFLATDNKTEGEFLRKWRLGGYRVYLCSLPDVTTMTNECVHNPKCYVIRSAVLLQVTLSQSALCH